MRSVLPRHPRALLPGLALALALTGLLGACAARPTGVTALLDRLGPTPLLLVGEQHDAPAHQALQRDLVQALAAEGRLAAVVMEMVEAGHQTDGLPSDADEARVRQALGWSGDEGWPWATYRPVVMAAVAAGVPVVGGNLPRRDMRAAMGDAGLDATVPAAALAAQREAIRTGHCDLLPASQLGPMARIQLARDRSLARVAEQRLAGGRTVLLIAGNGHVRADVGVPLHLPAGQPHRVIVARAGEAGSGVPADAFWDTPALPPQDHCAALRERYKR